MFSVMEINDETVKGEKSKYITVYCSMPFKNTHRKILKNTNILRVAILGYQYLFSLLYF